MIIYLKSKSKSVTVSASDLQSFVNCDVDFKSLVDSNWLDEVLCALRIGCRPTMRDTCYLSLYNLLWHATVLFDTILSSDTAWSYKYDSHALCVLPTREHDRRICMYSHFFCWDRCFGGCKPETAEQSSSSSETKRHCRVFFIYQWINQPINQNTFV